MITFKHVGNEWWWGRMGNQFFQIASTLGIALDHGHKFYFPEWKYREYFKNPLPFKSFAELEQMDLIVLEEKSLGHNCFSVHSDKNYDLQGFFQSFKYFDKYRSIIQYYFDFNDEVITTTRGKYFDLLREENLCSIHLRAGDYHQFPNHHPILRSDYYQSAILHFPNHKFLVFSDDINYCKSIFVGDNFHFVEGNSNIKDVCLMSLCKNNIIANSSFSWWGAYLNRNGNKKVVAPQNWFGPALSNEHIDDRLPAEWIKI